MTEINVKAIQKAALDAIKLEDLDPSLLEFKSIESVEIDALVMLQIIQHTSQLPTTLTATGQLLGVDQVGTLQLTHSFPFISVSDSQKDEDQEYQRTMLQCLRKMNCDANTVGWYQSTLLGSYWNQTLIETQFNYQSAFPQSIVLIYDPSRTLGKQHPSFTALRLSDTFMNFIQSTSSSNFNYKKFTMENLISHHFTPSTIFEFPSITVRRSYLLEPLLKEYNTDLNAVLTLHYSLTSPNPSLSSQVPVMDKIMRNPQFLGFLGFDPYLERNIEFLSDCADEYGQEQWRWQGWNRSLVKEYQKLNSLYSKRKQENASRVSQGLEPLYQEEDLNIQFSQSLNKVMSVEPSRLETLLIMNQMETYCKQIAHTM